MCKWCIFCHSSAALKILLDAGQSLVEIDSFCRKMVHVFFPFASKLPVVTDCLNIHKAFVIVQVRCWIWLSVIRYLSCSNSAYFVGLYSISFHWMQVRPRSFFSFVAEKCCMFLSVKQQSPRALNPLSSKLSDYRILAVQVPTRDLFCSFWFWNLCGCGVFLICSTAVLWKL